MLRLWHRYIIHGIGATMSFDTFQSGMLSHALDHDAHSVVPALQANHVSPKKVRNAPGRAGGCET